MKRRSVICGKHFKPSDFKSSSMKKLHDLAIPTMTSNNEYPNAMPEHHRVPVQELTPKLMVHFE